MSHLPKSMTQEVWAPAVKSEKSENFPNLQLQITNVFSIKAESVEKATGEPDFEELKCEICSTVFFTQESLEEHVIDAHVVDKEYDCSKCSKTFISQEILDLHELEHVEDEDEDSESSKGKDCPICGRPSVVKLSKHLLTHEIIKPIKCKSCSKSFVYEANLKTHEINSHGKGKRFQCPKCPKSYARNYLLQDHLRTHSDVKNLACERCGALFKTKQSLRQHWIFCKSGKIGDNQDERKNPARKRGALAKELKNGAANTEYKQHKCKFCGKIFLSAGNLKMHVGIHGSGWKFKCDSCSDSFRRKSDLKIHLKYHEEVKWSSCIPKSQRQLGEKGP